MRGRDDFEHRQLGDRRQRMRPKIERAGSGPGALERDIFKMVFDEFTDPRRTVDMRYDL